MGIWSVQDPIFERGISSCSSVSFLVGIPSRPEPPPRSRRRYGVVPQSSAPRASSARSAALPAASADRRSVRSIRVPRARSSIASSIAATSPAVSHPSTRTTRLRFSSKHVILTVTGTPLCEERANALCGRFPSSLRTVVSISQHYCRCRKTAALTTGREKPRNIVTSSSEPDTVADADAGLRFFRTLRGGSFRAVYRPADRAGRRRDHLCSRTAVGGFRHRPQHLDRGRR